jgi:hypothetical protein
LKIQKDPTVPLQKPKQKVDLKQTTTVKSLTAESCCSTQRYTNKNEQEKMPAVPKEPSLEKL